jgi:hypothetical protein
MFAKLYLKICDRAYLRAIRAVSLSTDIKQKKRVAENEFTPRKNERMGVR